MNYGQGSIGFTNKAGAGGGGTLNGADNGLSVVGTDVQLGGNPLLHDSTFDLADFIFTITNNGGIDYALILQGNPGDEIAVLISPGANQINLFLNDPIEQASVGNNNTNQQGLLIDFLNDIYQMGDIAGLNNATVWDVDDNIRRIIGMQNNNAGLSLDFLNYIFEMGDIPRVINGTAITIDDLAKLGTIGTTAGLMLNLDQGTALYQMGDINGALNGTEIEIDDTAGYFLVQNYTGANQGLFIGLTALQYGIGDLGPVGNGTEFTINDSAKFAQIGTTAGGMFSVDQDTGQYEIGDIGVINNGFRFLLDDTGLDAVIYGSVTNQRLLALTESTGDYSIGDLDVIANGTRMIMHDTTQVFEFVTAASGVLFRAEAAGIETLPPTGGISSANNWQLGSVVTAASAFDATRYLEINVGGSIVKLALCA